VLAYVYCYGFFPGFNFDFSVHSWKERLWYDLFSVECDVKSELNQLFNQNSDTCCC